jgi:hypothetical protein
MKRYLLSLVVLSLMTTLDLCAQTVPQIVAQVSLTGQTARITFTPIYTPPNAGLFRVTTYMIITTAVKNNNVNLVPLIKWTDETGHSELDELQNLPVNARPPFATQTATLTFEAAASQPIEYRVGGGAQGVVYSLYITVEQLQ